ncbi:unnamed protein product [Gordionus sp. m RMFG-2023]|uniref:putative uncharacterized protein DDB_G0281251 n=1 Tax=Gordionus sp. m RMFG-2023 TaxID=3053472 RepID=UPI0030E33698
MDHFTGIKNTRSICLNACQTEIISTITLTPTYKQFYHSNNSEQQPFKQSSNSNYTSSSFFPTNNLSTINNIHSASAYKFKRRKLISLTSSALAFKGKLLRLSLSKLGRINDPEVALRRCVLIYNAAKTLKREILHLEDRKTLWNNNNINLNHQVTQRVNSSTNYSTVTVTSNNKEGSHEVVLGVGEEPFHLNPNILRANASILPMDTSLGLSQPSNNHNELGGSGYTAEDFDTGFVDYHNYILDHCMEASDSLNDDDNVLINAQDRAVKSHATEKNFGHNSLNPSAKIQNSNGFDDFNLTFSNSSSFSVLDNVSQSLVYSQLPLSEMSDKKLASPISQEVRKEHDIISEFHSTPNASLSNSSVVSVHLDNSMDGFQVSPLTMTVSSTFFNQDPLKIADDSSHIAYYDNNLTFPRIDIPSNIQISRPAHDGHLDTTFHPSRSKNSYNNPINPILCQQVASDDVAKFLLPSSSTNCRFSLDRSIHQFIDHSYSNSPDNPINSTHIHYHHAINGPPPLEMLKLFDL